ncbi:MAG: hypothetical protein ACJ8FF_08845, partial [Sphingomicrobium sp.]
MRKLLVVLCATAMVGGGCRVSNAPQADQANGAADATANAPATTAATNAVAPAAQLSLARLDCGHA